MLTRTVRLQLIAFIVIAVVAVVYALFRFAGLGKFFGEEGYTVRMNLADSGGVFSNAEVTYRGVNVGRVGELRLTKDGIQVDLNIDPDAPEIPADVDAVVANRSAVGEQYVDLRPRKDSGPYLSAASVIPADRTKTPVGTDTVLRDLDSLATSVPTDALRKLVDELYLAFKGTGQDLQVLLDSTKNLTDAASANLPQTIQLINTGGTVLDTQNAESSNLTAFGKDLRLLAEQLKTSDPDIRRLITATPPAATAITKLLSESGTGLSVLFANLLTTSRVLAVRTDGLEYSLVAYPLLTAAAQGLLASGDGTAHLGLVLNLFNPPPCTKGYENTQRRDGNQTGPAPPLPTQTYCAEPTGSPINVRGSQNAPFNGIPKEPSQAEIAANANRPQEQLAGLARGSLPGTVSQPGIGGLASLASLLGLS
ncbi:MAG TPA: MCE family protein [Actinophytocola sp.]|jgi:phospholipid/cholesterol/gamma-HCH transport system substrate-binding protein|uniref:MCE family protein n=1 Tax=Actinophytocola sp. TaxID=1872138 RepID=UPI002E077F92|nr:MCE family protein [Actinophytocola sp.]